MALICYYFRLYTWAFTQMFPTGSYVRRKEEDNFKPLLSDRYQLMYRWMEFYGNKHNMDIHHKMNRATEKRDAKYLADGWAEPTDFLAPGAISGVQQSISSSQESPRGSPKGLILQFDGCYFHGHECYLTKHVTDKKLMQERAKKTAKRNEYYLKEGYDLLVERECSFLAKMRHDPALQKMVDEGRPEFYKDHKGTVTKDQLLQAVREDKIFGALEVGDFKTLFSDYLSI